MEQLTWPFGFVDDKGKAAKFLEPEGIAFAKPGLLFVADTSNNRIRKMACVAWSR